MTAKMAANLFAKKFHDRMVLGYWEDQKGIILQVSPSLPGRAEEPCQFLVTDDGLIYPTNPVVNPSIMRTKMKIFTGLGFTIKE